MVVFKEEKYTWAFCAKWKKFRVFYLKNEKKRNRGDECNSEQAKQKTGDGEDANFENGSLLVN